MLILLPPNKSECKSIFNVKVHGLQKWDTVIHVLEGLLHFGTVYNAAMSSVFSSLSSRWRSESLCWYIILISFIATIPCQCGLERSSGCLSEEELHSDVLFHWYILSKEGGRALILFAKCLSECTQIRFSNCFIV